MTFYTVKQWRARFFRMSTSYNYLSTSRSHHLSRSYIHENPPLLDSHWSTSYSHICIIYFVYSIQPCHIFVYIRYPCHIFCLHHIAIYLHHKPYILSTSYAMSHILSTSNSHVTYFVHIIWPVVYIIQSCNIFCLHHIPKSYIFVYITHTFCLHHIAKSYILSTSYGHSSTSYSHVTYFVYIQQPCHIFCLHHMAICLHYIAMSYILSTSYSYVIYFFYIIWPFVYIIQPSHFRIST